METLIATQEERLENAATIDLIPRGWISDVNRSRLIARAMQGKEITCYLSADHVNLWIANGDDRAKYEVLPTGRFTRWSDPAADDVDPDSVCAQ